MNYKQELLLLRGDLAEADIKFIEVWESIFGYIRLVKINEKLQFEKLNFVKQYIERTTDSLANVIEFGDSEEKYIAYVYKNFNDYLLKSTSLLEKIVILESNTNFESNLYRELVEELYSQENKRSKLIQKVHRTMSYLIS